MSKGQTVPFLDENEEKTEIEKPKEFFYNGEKLKSDGTCPICFSPLSKIMGKIEQCPHLFCLECLESWIQVRCDFLKIICYIFEFNSNHLNSIGCFSIHLWKFFVSHWLIKHIFLIVFPQINQTCPLDRKYIFQIHECEAEENQLKKLDTIYVFGPHTPGILHGPLTEHQTQIAEEMRMPVSSPILFWLWKFSKFLNEVDSCKSLKFLLE